MESLSATTVGQILFALLAVATIIMLFVSGLARFSSRIDAFVLAVGRYFSALNVILIVAIIVQVVLRYVFGLGLVQLEELQWHLYAVNVIFGLAFCQSQDSHIRLDLIYDKMARKNKDKVEILGILILLLPLIYVFFVHSIDFVWEAIRTNERSDSPVGLCCRWIPKGMLPIAFSLFFLSAIARLANCYDSLKSIKKGV